MPEAGAGPVRPMPPDGSFHAGAEKAEDAICPELWYNGQARCNTGGDPVDTVQLAVRTLVEFTIHGENIQSLGGTAKAMQEGMLGHKARQALLGEGWESEVPVSLMIPLEDEDAALRISGRMDAFMDGEVPVIEEIKLCRDRHVPEAPWPAHQAQAMCYGHMLCRERGIGQVMLRVAYVDRRGRVHAQFDTALTAGQCQEQFQALLMPYLRRLRLLRAHRRTRDASLRALCFPYPDYRAGQRDMAVQVYTAIRLGRRLFASMPTGTGKSVAALFPALKALGEGLTSQVYYLTARTTQRQGALEALERMRRQTLHLWTLTLDAKDKQCPEKTLCHPDWCPRARGHFLRDSEALEEMLLEDDWSPEAIRRMADKHQLCPFEFSLSLAEIADLTLCDYNYALDPAVHIQCIFDRTSDVTLLIDEAHHLLERVRDMLSGAVDGPGIRRLRTVVGKTAGRKHPLYKAMTETLHALTDLPVQEDAEEGRLADIPQSLDRAASSLAEALMDAGTEHFPWNDAGERMGDTLTALLGFLRARRRDEREYAFLWQGRKQRVVTALALEVGGYFRETTASMRGVVCFSATMDPLEDMKRLLGGEEEDACFAMPSPFPRENLLVLQESINTRYRWREAACGRIVDAIRRLWEAKAGKYIVFFPSFAFLRQVAQRLDIPHQAQRADMSDEERRAFLAPYRPEGEPVLSLCVLGGVFSEGIDLPGAALDGVAVVGVGLPQVGLFQETLREHYEQTLGSGFLYAYMIPGMQKVAQAVGRVIRTQEDRGVALLLDDRYLTAGYRRLCPPHWTLERGSGKLRAFWEMGESRSLPLTNGEGLIK